jgi:hypothetical protein
VAQPSIPQPVLHRRSRWLPNDSFEFTTSQEEHRKLALAVRHFVDSEVIPEARAHEQTGERPSIELIKKMAENKINYARLGPGKHLHGLTLPGGMKGEDFDYLGELVSSLVLCHNQAD